MKNEKYLHSIKSNKGEKYHLLNAGIYENTKYIDICGRTEYFSTKKHFYYKLNFFDKSDDLDLIDCIKCRCKLNRIKSREISL